MQSGDERADEMSDSAARMKTERTPAGEQAVIEDAATESSIERVEGQAISGSSNPKDDRSIRPKVKSGCLDTRLSYIGVLRTMHLLQRFPNCRGAKQMERPARKH